MGGSGVWSLPNIDFFSFNFSKNYTVSQKIKFVKIDFSFVSVCRASFYVNMTTFEDFFLSVIKVKTLENCEQNRPKLKK